jgi:hypothetical protein
LALGALLDGRRQLFIEQLDAPGNVAAVEYRKIGLIPLRFLARKGPQFRLFQKSPRKDNTIELLPYAVSNS